MTPTLRPMSLGEILDRTFQIYRARFLLFIAIAALETAAVWVVYVALLAWQTRHPVHGRILLFGLSYYRVVLYALTYAAYGLAQLLLRPAFIRIASGAVTGERYTLLKSLSLPIQRWKTMLAINAAEQVIVVFVPAATFIIGFTALTAAIHPADGDVASRAAAVLVMFLIGGVTAIAFCWFGACISLAFPAAVLEGASWFAAIKRSWQVSTKSRGRIIFTWLSVLIGSSVAKVALAGIVYFVFRSVRGSLPLGAASSGYSIAYSLASATVSILRGPIYPIALTLFYYDQRIRHEGFDIEQMMTAAGLNPTAAASAPAIDAPLPDAPFPPPAPQPLTQEDRA